jgi:hypothetical protein
MNIDILLKRYYAIRKAWINSTNTDQEKEYFDKLQIIEKEIKAYKASMEAKNPAANAMAQYVKFGIKEDKDA